MTDVLSQPLSDAAFAEEEEEIRRLEQEIADAEKRAQEEELKARQYAAEAQAAEDEVRAVSGYVDLAASTEFGDEPNESLLHSANATGTINSPRDNSVSSAGDALPALNLIDVEIPTMPAELAHIQKAVDAEVAAAFTMAPPQELVTIVTPPAKEFIVNETSAVKPSSVPSLSVEPVVQASRPVSAPLDQFVDAPSVEATITVVTEPTKQEPAPVPPRSSSVSSAGPELASVAEEPAGQDPALLEQVAQLQSRYSELERKHKALETLHEESQDLEKELEAHVQLLEREAQENREELKARMKELAEVQARARDIAAERADIERRLQDTEVLLDKMVQHQQESKSKFEKKLADLQVSFDSANKRLQQADSEITHLQREIQKLSTDQVVLKQEIRHLEAENDKLQKKNRIERGYHEAFEKKYNDAEERIVLLQQEMIEIQTEKAEIVRRLNEEIPHEEHRIKSDKAPNFSLIEEHIQQLTVEQRAALLRKFTVEELAAVGAHIPAAGTIPTVSEAVASRPLARQGTLTRMGTLVPPISGLPGLLRTSSIGSRNSTVGVPGVDRPYESQPAFVPSPRRTSSFMSPRDVLESATASAAAVKAAAGPQSASHVMPLPKNSLLETGLQITDASGRPVARVVEDKYSGLVIQPLSAVMEGGAPASARAGGGEETEAQGGISGSNDASYVSRNRASTVTLPVDYERSELEEDPHRGRPSVSNTESLRLIDDRYQAYPAAEKGHNKRGCCSVGACGGRPTANSVDGGCVIS